MNISDFSRTCNKLWIHNIPSPLCYSWNLVPVQASHALPCRFHLCSFPLTFCLLCPCAKIFCDVSPFWLNHSVNVSLEKVLSQISLGFLAVREVVLRGCQLLVSACLIQIFLLNRVNAHIYHGLPDTLSGWKQINPCILRVSLHIVFQLLTSSFITNITK